MDSYLDLTVLADPEFPSSLLLNALFSKLHRALVGQGGRIGVSFPKVSEKGLGEILRLHGTRSALEALTAKEWMTGMRDHLMSGEIKSIPMSAKHRVVRRVQAKSNPERLRRRLIIRKALDTEAARQAIPDTAGEFLNLPYLTIKSRSTGQQFRLFIEHAAIQDHPVVGSFSAYGLSSTGTIPWF